MIHTIGMDKVNEYLRTEFDKDNWNCFSLVKEFYPELDIDTEFKNLNGNKEQINDAIENRKDLIEEITKPVEQCLVLMNGYHIGIFYKGKILHNDEPQIRYEPLHQLKYKYKNIRFFRVKDKNE
jgi:hypothetical protein